MSHHRCCCDVVTFTRLTLCDCSGGGGTGPLWTSRYNPLMGYVWAKIGESCYWIGPDSDAKSELGPFDTEVNPALYEANSEEDACTECCDTNSAEGCCDISGGTCGHTRSSPPYVTLSMQLSVPTLTTEIFCGDCVKKLWTPWSQPWSSGSAFPGGGFVCAPDDDGDGVGNRNRLIGHPCLSQDTELGEHATAKGTYSLWPVINFEPHWPVGYNDGDKMVLGTSNSPPSPSLWGYTTFGFGSASVGSVGFIISMAASMVDPTKWWLEIRGKNVGGTGSIAASGSVTTPGGCIGRMDATFDITQVDEVECNNQPRTLTSRAVGTLGLVFNGIGACGGAQPWSPPPFTLGNVRDPGDERVKRHIEAQTAPFEEGCCGE